MLHEYAVRLTGPFVEPRLVSLLAQLGAIRTQCNAVRIASPCLCVSSLCQREESEASCWRDP